MEKSADLILLHSPSIYDFRKCNNIIIPDINSTTISSTSIFEILPLGFYNIKSFLETHNISVKIYNIADMMLKDWDFDVESFLFTLRPMVFGIDLHWLIQAQGALELAKVVKKIHKDKPILFGGISASYFYKELITYPFVDFVIRGNITLHPIEKLMKLIIKNDRDYSMVPNLSYKKDGKVVNNPIEIHTKKDFYPINWNNKEVYRKDINIIIMNPQSGCRYNCCFCGGSNYATQKYSLQERAVLYKPLNQILKELDSMRNFVTSKNKDKKVKLITIGHWFDNKRLNEKILNKFRSLGLFSTVHISLFDLIPIKTVTRIVKYSNPVFEISPQSHDSRIRRLCQCTGYSNEKLETWCKRVLELKVKRIEVYFMIGLPGQTVDSVFKTVEYCEYLLKSFKDKKKMIPFLSPMIPFLDPASLAFEMPDRYGYRIFYKTLSEHKDAMTRISFKNRLNYETKWMSRAQIVEATYRAMKMLTQAKICHGYLTPNIGNAIIFRLDYSHRMLNALDRIDSIKEKDRKQRALKEIRKKISIYNRETLKNQFSDQKPANIPFYNFWYET